MYKRKTVDQYELQVNYGFGHGWETEIIEDTLKEAKEQKKSYQENCNYPIRIVKKRVKKENL